MSKNKIPLQHYILNNKIADVYPKRFYSLCVTFVYPKKFYSLCFFDERGFPSFPTRVTSIDEFFDRN